MTPSEKQTVALSRLAYFDTLRAVMVAFVVIMHVAFTYSGIGSWYYIENKSTDIVSRFIFGVYQSLIEGRFTMFRMIENSP